jgi:hypothetical protein
MKTRDSKEQAAKIQTADENGLKKGNSSDLDMKISRNETQ